MAATKFRPRPWGWHDIERLVELREVQRLTWRRSMMSFVAGRPKCCALSARDGQARTPEGHDRPPAPHFAEPKPAARDVVARTAERDARRDAYDRRDLTATFCGDPPVGYSALDRMRGRR
jgi:hypothetical protein